jgi:hypothetical protein
MRKTDVQWIGAATILRGSICAPCKELTI